MTREAIEVLQASIKQLSHTKIIVDGKFLSVKIALEMAINALEQEPCEDAISRQAVLDGIDTYISKAQSTGTQDDFYSFAELVVKVLPSVNPQKLCTNCQVEEKQGHWIYSKNERNSFVNNYTCSVCGWKKDSCRGLMQDTGHNLFCEHCGVKMTGMLVTLPE